MKTPRWPRGIGLDKRQARRLRRRQGRCTCDPRHLEVGGIDPWCLAHAARVQVTR